MIGCIKSPFLKESDGSGSMCIESVAHQTWRSRQDTSNAPENDGGFFGVGRGCEEVLGAVTTQQAVWSSKEGVLRFSGPWVACKPTGTTS